MLAAITIRKDSKMRAGSTTTSFMDSIVEMWVHQGFICFIRVDPSGGHLCGYVAVPLDHPIVGHTTSEAECTKYEVHGGVTWNEAWPVGGWLVGMDCNHLGRDYAPNLPQLGQDPADEKGRVYVKKQVEKLASQLRWDYILLRK